MGSAIKQQLSRLLTCALAVCMVAALMPAAAFAAPAVEDGDGTGANAFTGSGGTAQANTEMYLSVAQRFRAAEAFVSPAATMGTAESSTAELGAVFEGGTPKVDGSLRYYEASWAWQTTAELKPSSGTYPASPTRVAVSDGAEDAPEVKLGLGAFFDSLGFAEAARPGIYTFTLTVKGEGCTAVQEFEFEIVKSRAVKDSITEAGITVYGSFDVAAGLAVADLAAAGSSAQQGLYDTFVAAAGTSLVDAAYQLNVVNDTFLDAPELSYLQERVEFPAGAAVIEAAQASPARKLTLLVLVGNKLEQREYAVSGGVTANKICYANVSDANDVLTLQEKDGAWTASFQNSDPAQAIGAFAIAYAPKPADPGNPDEPAKSYSVKVIVRGTGSGTFSPDEALKSYAAGAKPTYVFQAAEGSQIADIAVTDIDGTSSYAGEYTRLANAVTLNGDGGRGIEGHAAITVTFNKVDVPVVPGGEPPTCDLSVVSNEPGTVAVGYTGLQDGQEQRMDTLIEAADTGVVRGIVEGTEVQLDISAPTIGDTGYVIDKVWVSAADVPEQQAKVDANRMNLNGTSRLVIAAMQASASKVWIEYVPGIAPPVLKNTVYGVVSGDAASGEFAGMTAEVDGAGAKTGRYHVDVVENYSQDIRVNAAANMAVESVLLYKGASPDALAGVKAQVLYSWSAGDAYVGTFEHRIASVACDYTVVARFQERASDPGTPDEHKSVYRAVAGAHGNISPASAEVAQGGAPAAFTIAPERGYRIASVSLYNETSKKDESAKLPAFDTLDTDGDTIELGYLGDASYVLSATFAKKLVDPDKVYRLIAHAVVIGPDGSAVAGDGGTISPTSTAVTAGGRQVFTMVPAPGYDLVRVAANGHDVAVTKHDDGYFYFIAEDVQSNLSITAFYQKAADGDDSDGDAVEGLPVRVHVRAVGPGSVQPAGLVDVARGTDLPVRMVPDAGCRLKSLMVDGVDVTPLGEGAVEYVLKTVMHEAGQHVSVVATFADASGTVVPPQAGDDVSIDVDVAVKASTVNADGKNAFGDVVGGEVSPVHATVAWGGEQRFIIKPKNGSYVVRGSVKAQDSLTGAEVPVEFGTIDLDAGQRSAAGQNNFTAQVRSDVQMGYSWVRASDIKGDLILTVEFSGCDQSTGRYVYDKASDTVVDTTPDVDGDIEVEYPDNDPDAIVGEYKDIVVRPGSADERITQITIYGHTLGFVDKDGDGKMDQVVVDGSTVHDIVPAGDPEAVRKAIDGFNRVVDKVLGYDKQPGHSADSPNPYVSAVVGDAGSLDGSYALHLPTVDANGNKVDLGLKVDATGNGGVLYQHAVNLKVATEGGSRGGYLTVARNSLADSLGNVDCVQMNHGGLLLVTAHAADEGDLVRFSVDDPGNIAEDLGRNLQLTVPLASDGRAADAPKAYVVSGPGTVTATFYKSGEPGGPDGPDGPGGSDEPDGPDGPGSILGPADVEAGRAYAITAAIEPDKAHGTISPQGTLYYAVGRNAEFNLIPKNGYRVSAVVVDGVRYPWNASKYLFTSGQGGKHHTITAEFVLDTAGPLSPATKVMRTMQSLAQTGDLAAPGVLGLTAIALGAVGAAFLVDARRRREKAAATATE